MSTAPHASQRAARTGNDEFLLTPGPLTTSFTVKQAMLRDWGSRDKKFIALNARIRDKLVQIAGGGSDYTCVPVQGSGTFAIEATLGTLLPRDGRLLVLVNGAYGERMMKIAKYMGRSAIALSCAEDRTPDLTSLETLLAEDAAITHVAAVHCETTSGILNPIREIADIVAKHGRGLIIDAMSAFGAIPLDVGEVTCDAVVASSNKCLEGVPGMGYAIIRRSVLEGCEGNAHSLALDLYDQWRGFEANAQWRFTPPTHVLAAFDQAVAEFEEEGGVAARNGRYSENRRTLVAGMREMGFETLLPDELQAPIIVTFHMPADPKFDFAAFYDELAARGYVIYPGKLTVAPTFRIGCIGQLQKQDMEDALAVIRETVDEMGVKLGALAGT
ncbi:MAG: 2-aminoethylphosphonate--pyruvate transaminase [Alphaproteobacteria bacterium]|nr:2-aminoethylphosphonate--pyruvate transaminase [Alphaproteobacteria bacterium]